MDRLKKQLINTLAHYGARNVTISRKQQMKLREWILPYLIDEFELGGFGPMKIEEMRKFIALQAEHISAADARRYVGPPNREGMT